MAKLKLVRYPSETLRKPCAEIAFPLKKEHAELVGKMIFACKKFKGVGLAAPQIGQNLKLAVINLEHFDLPAFAIINPAITGHSRKTTDMEEGCLSLPKKFGIVKRPEKIKVRFSRPDGKKIEMTLEGFAAKVFQHEIDHLNGILICDKWDESTVNDGTAKHSQQI